MSRSAVPTSVRGLRHLLIEQRRQQESDEDLLHAFVLRREESAFALLVRRHGPMVFHVCRRVLGHAQDAEDAFQATFLLLARKAATLRNRAALASWLHGAAYRTALKAKQAAARRRKHEARTPPRTVDNPTRELLWREVQALLDEEIALLPEIYRSVFVLCCLENLNRAETARRLGLKEGTISSRLAEARQRLQQRLARRGAELTALLAATALATQSASALPPMSLARMGGTALSPTVSALADSGSSIWSFGKAKLAVFLLMVGVLSGAGLWAFREPAAPRVEAAKTPAARSSDKTQTAAPKREVAKTVKIQGRVLGPDGKPKAGAKILLLGPLDIAEQGELLLEGGRVRQLGVSAADGRFTVAVSKAKQKMEHYLVGQGEGAGINFFDAADLNPEKPIEFHLVKDHVIRGRIVNTEGKPVAGVRVAVDNLGVYPNNSLDSFLATWKKQQRVTSGLPNGVKHIWEGAGTLLAATTDAEGRFTLPHVGEERLVSLRLSGGGIADAEVWVTNRRGFDPKPYNEAVLHNSMPTAVQMFGNRWRLHGPDLSVVAEAGKTIRGVVKDIDTGKGRPGVEVILSKDGDGRLLTGPLMKARTDKQGRYEIRGARKGKSYMLEVMADAAAGYMPCQIRVADTPGYQAIAADVHVKKGVIVTGKVIDKQTGKAIPGWVRVGILHDNPFVKDYPAFGSSAWVYTPRTDDVGVFRVVAVPCSVLLMGGPDQQRLADKNAGHLKYKPVRPDPDYPQYFSKKGQQNSLGVPYVYYGRDGAITPVSGNFCKVLETKAGVAVVKQDVFLEAGTALPIRIRDADNRPVAKTWVAGRSPMEGWPIACAADACAAYNLEPGKSRLMVFFEPTRKLAGTWTLKGDETQPVVVKLGPAGALGGRLFDAEGKPLAEVVVDVHYRDREAEEVHEVVHKAKQVVTDVSGAFVLDELIPALKFELSFRRDKHRFERTAKPAEPNFEVKPGETRDAGAIELQRVAEKMED